MARVERSMSRSRTLGQAPRSRGEVAGAGVA